MDQRMRDLLTERRKRCQVRIDDSTGWGRTHQCSRKAVADKGDAGRMTRCTQHSKAAQAARDAKRDATYQAEQRRYEAIADRGMARSELVDKVEQLLEAVATQPHALTLRLPSKWRDELQALVGRARR